MHGSHLSLCHKDTAQGTRGISCLSLVRYDIRMQGLGLMRYRNSKCCRDMSLRCDMCMCIPVVAYQEDDDAEEERDDEGDVEGGLDGRAPGVLVGHGVDTGEDEEDGGEPEDGDGLDQSHSQQGQASHLGVFRSSHGSLLFSLVVL